MEALRTVQTTHDGVLRIEVPEHFRNTQLEVIVVPLYLEQPGTAFDAGSIEQYFGTAKYPLTETKKSDAYNQ